LKFKFPGLILFSLRREVAHDTFWHTCHELEAGRRFPIGEPTEAIFKIFPLYCFLYRRINTDPTSDGVDGFMEAMTSCVFNWCSPKQGGTFLGRHDRLKVSEQRSRI